VAWTARVDRPRPSPGIRGLGMSLSDFFVGHKSIARRLEQVWIPARFEPGLSRFPSGPI
jgi:hypothetical protein